MLSFHYNLPAVRNGKPTLPSHLFCFPTVLLMGCICMPFSHSSSRIQASSFIICLGHYHFTGWTPLVKEACYPSQVKEDGHLKIILRDALLLDGLTLVACSIMCLIQNVPPDSKEAHHPISMGESGSVWIADRGASHPHADHPQLHISVPVAGNEQPPLPYSSSVLWFCLGVSCIL